MHDDVTREATPCSISGLTCSHPFLCYSQSPLKKPIFMLSFRVLPDYGFICTTRWSYLPPAPDCPVVRPLAPTSHGGSASPPHRLLRQLRLFIIAGTPPTARFLSAELFSIMRIAKGKKGEHSPLSFLLVTPGAGSKRRRWRVFVWLFEQRRE